MTPDGGVTGVAWQWARSSDGGSWADIAGAADTAYTPQDADLNHYLRARATYDDDHGPGKSAEDDTPNAVRQAGAALTASQVVYKVVTLTLTGHADEWWATITGDPGCHNVPAGHRPTPGGLDPVSTYTVTAYSDSECATAIASVTFTTLPNRAPEACAVKLESPYDLGDGSVIETYEAVLDGSCSSDPDGDRLTYAWTVQDGWTWPGGVDLAGDDGPEVAVLQAPDVPEDTGYRFTLTATDEQGASSAPVYMWVVVRHVPPGALRAVTVRPNDGYAELQLVGGDYYNGNWSYQFYEGGPVGIAPRDDTPCHAVPLHKVSLDGLERTWSTPSTPSSAKSARSLWPAFPPSRWSR